MLYWRRETVGGREGGCRHKRMEESKIGHGGRVKSLLCMCAIQEDGQRRGGVHNSLISVRVVLPEPLFSHEEEEEEVAACWLTLCAAALRGDGTSCF